MLSRAFATGRGRQAFRTLGSDLGYDVVARDWASPIPDLTLLDAGAWERESALISLPEMKADRQLTHLEELKPYLDEFRPPVGAARAGPGEFYLGNLAFEAVDADLLYGTVRSSRPGTMIEIGSGFSTLVLDQAARRNAQDGDPVRLITIDPYPSPLLEGLDAEVRSVRGSEVPLPEFEALGAGDILFMDTSHTVKIGSEVNYLVLEVLPRLAPGVLVHFHDIFVPWEYPRKWVEESRWYWAEQYLVHAFLAFNEEFEILFSSQLVARTEPQRLRALIPAFAPTTSRPTSFWVRRKLDPSR